MPNKTEHIKKQAVLQALEKTLGIVTRACKIAEVGRTTYYEWLQKDKEFAQKVEDINNIQLDFAETKLFENINANKETSIIFYLKTKGKQRGYIEKQQHDITTDGDKINEVKIEIVKP